MLVCKQCGGELAKSKPTKSRRKKLPVQDLCIRCQLAKLGWKDSSNMKQVELK